MADSSSLEPTWFIDSDSAADWQRTASGAVRHADGGDSARDDAFHGR